MLFINMHVDLLISSHHFLYWILWIILVMLVKVSKINLSLHLPEYQGDWPSLFVVIMAVASMSWHFIHFDHLLSIHFSFWLTCGISEKWKFYYKSFGSQNMTSYELSFLRLFAIFKNLFLVNIHEFQCRNINVFH